jgi:lysophospholipase L1-like esterase
MKPRVNIKNILLLFFVTLVTFISLELLLARFWPHKVTTRQYHGKYHPVIGWVNKPYVQGKVKVTGNVYFFRTHNNKGLRSTRPADYDNPMKKKRVLLLGDSFFWGFGVDDMHVLSEVLQEMIGDNGEIINGAVTGYGTDQELLWLAEEGMKYQPGLVILGFFPANDLDEIANSIMYAIMYGYPKPYFSFEGERLVVRNIPVPDTRETRRKAFEEVDTWFGKVKKYLRYNVHTYQFIVNRLNSIQSLRRFFLTIGIAEEFTKELPGIPHLKLSPDKVQELSDGLIGETKNASESVRAEFLLVFIPKKENNRHNSLRYKEVKEDAYDWNTRVSKYLRAFTSENNINYLDLLPIIRRHHERGEHLYTPEEYDHHWTPLGHKVAAEAMYEWLKEKGYLEQKS